MLVALATCVEAEMLAPWAVALEGEAAQSAASEGALVTSALARVALKLAVASVM
jgi:hypothetical protein